MATLKPQLRVSVFSDYICPFCYVGSRRLLRLNEDYDLKVNWCGLEIHPDTPTEGMPVEALGYPEERLKTMLEVLAQIAAEEEIPLAEHRFTTNSRRALLLAEAAKQGGRETFYRLHERLFCAFFTEGRNIGDEAVLRGLADEAGVGVELVERAWTDPAVEQRLQANLRIAVQLGLTATPTYIIGRKILVGAVPLEDLRQAAAGAAESTHYDA